MINKIWERKNFILSVSEFPGSHTGDRIREKVQEMLKAWNIKVEKCHLFLRDGGTNFKKVCFNHRRVRGWSIQSECGTFDDLFFSHGQQCRNQVFSQEGVILVIFSLAPPYVFFEIFPATAS